MMVKNTMAETPSKVQHGYLVLADISGYTSFLAGTELEHAHEILTDLLTVIVEKFKTLLTISKLEGDAVFAQAPANKVMRGETLLELIESTYSAFRDRAENMRRRTTCECRACKNIPSLDLKFLVHHGDYMIQNISGVKELAGSDVNLIHRLLKNHVTEATGWKAYTLFTEKSLKEMGIQAEGMQAGREPYEHLGEVKTYSMDLRSRYQALDTNRRIVVEPKEAFISAVIDYDAPPPVVWSWLNDSSKRHLYGFGKGVMFQAVARPGGRTGVGATTHCVHGKDIAMVETVLDWKPFDYYTVEQQGGPFGVVRLTVKLTPQAGDKTRVEMYLAGSMPGLPTFLHRPIILFIYTRFFDYKKIFENAGKVMSEALASEAQGAAESQTEPTTAAV